MVVVQGGDGTGYAARRFQRSTTLELIITTGRIRRISGPACWSVSDQELESAEVRDWTDSGLRILKPSPPESRRAKGSLRDRSPSPVLPALPAWNAASQRCRRVEPKRRVHGSCDAPV